MIELVKDHQGYRVLVITCDVCHEPIRQAELAMVRWRRSDGEGKAPVTNLEYCHKGQCDQSIRDWRDDPWMELEHFLARLILNTGMDLKHFHDAVADVGGVLQTLG